MQSQPTRNQGEPDNNNNNDIDDNSNEENEPIIWSKDLEKHSCGEFSYAVATAEGVMGEYSQVDVGSNAIFVGIYDGHVGIYASRFISTNLMANLIRSARAHNTINEQTLREAILATERGFLCLVHRAQIIDPTIVTSGSSCLVCVIYKGKLFIAHVGTSRAVYGMIHASDNSLNAVQLTMEHDVDNFFIRQQLLALHHNDPNLLVRDDYGEWHIKGRTEISKSIGDAYLKLTHFRNPQCYEFFDLPSPLRKPVVSAVPSLYSRPIEDSDRFFIFASDELWRLLTIHRAVEIVHTNPRDGIARRLVKAAIEEAAGISDFRLFFIDHITVIVVFVNHELVGKKDTDLMQRTFGFRGWFDDADQPSSFMDIDELM